MLTLFSIFKTLINEIRPPPTMHSSQPMLFQLINTCLRPELKLGYGVAAPGFEQFSGKDLLLCSPYNSIGMSIVISLVFIDLYLSNLRSFTKQGQQDDSFNSSMPSQIDMPCTIKRAFIDPSGPILSHQVACLFQLIDKPVYVTSHHRGRGAG